MVIYFSGTGNSRYVAESIAMQINDTVINANELIRSSKRAEFISDTPYVFVSPTYAWRVPRVFMDLIGNGSFEGNKNGYFVMTCGDDIGNANTYLKKLCKKNNLQYMGVFKVLMPENYIAVFKVPEKAAADEIISQADKIIPVISSMVRDGKAFPGERISIFARLKSCIMNPLFYSAFVSAKGFKASEKCISCGKCAEVCPLNNIKIVDGRPVYGYNCTHCMACISSCPVEAIDYKNTSVGQPRYYNTKSPISKLIN